MSLAYFCFWKMIKVMIFKTDHKREKYKREKTEI